MEIKKKLLCNEKMEGMEAKARLVPSWIENSLVLMEVYKGKTIHSIPTSTSQFYCF